jgi:hypothetical protein
MGPQPLPNNNLINYLQSFHQALYIIYLLHPWNSLRNSITTCEETENYIGESLLQVTTRRV